MELTGETARAYAAADHQVQREMANRLLADHIELAGAGEAEVAAGSEIVPVQDLDIAEIADAIYQAIPRTAGIAQIGVSGDQGTVRVDIQTARPGVAFGHGGAGVDRLRAELEELTGKPAHLTVAFPEEVDRLGAKLEERS